MSYIEFNERYDIHMNRLDFLSLTQSVPSTWKQSTRIKLLHNEINLYHIPNRPAFILAVIQQKKTCNFIYWKLQNFYKIINNNPIDKWNNTLNLINDLNFWENIHLATFYTTIDTRLRTFQYKLIRRTLPTNVHLKIYGIKDTDICDLCHDEIETYQHLLYYCRITQQLITDLKLWMSPNLIFLHNPTAKDIILGYNDIPHINTRNMINTMCLILKNYIYRCKCKNVLPTFRSLLLEIKKRYTFENNSEHYRTKEKWTILKNKVDNI